MTPIDYFLLLFCGASMALSLWRGFVREVISLIGLVAAFLIAGRTSASVGDVLHRWIPNSTVADIFAFIIVFLAVMIGIGLMGLILRKMVDAAALTAMDRTLGMMFGLARGVLLIALFFLIFTSYNKELPGWMRGVLVPYAIEMGDLLGRTIPAGYPFSRQAALKKNVVPYSDREALKTIILKSMSETR